MYLIRRPRTANLTHYDERTPANSGSTLTTCALLRTASPLECEAKSPTSAKIVNIFQLQGHNERCRPTKNEKGASFEDALFRQLN